MLHVVKKCTLQKLDDLLLVVVYKHTEMILNNSILPLKDFELLYSDQTASTGLDAFLSALSFGKLPYYILENEDKHTDTSEDNALATKISL